MSGCPKNYTWSCQQCSNLCKDYHISKPATIQSAEEFAKSLEWMSINRRPDINQWVNHIKARDAAQRQAGREEALAEERGTRSPGLNADDNKRMDELVTVYSKEALADSILAWEKQSKRYAALEEALRMYADEMFYFPRSLILLAQERGVRLAPCYSEFGERARKALADLEGK